jgi:hypothetical protein
VSEHFQYPDPTDKLGVDIYRSIPTDMLETLDRYLEQGLHPGEAMAAVLANNLRMAFNYGDEAFLGKLRVLVRYLWNRCPSGAWGSDDTVQEWVTSSQERRESFMRHYEGHREYMKTRRRQDAEFAASCRENDGPDKEE